MHVLPYSPVPPTYGARLRVYNLLKQMVRAHEVTVVCVGDEGTAGPLREAFSGRLRKVIVSGRHFARRVRHAAKVKSFLGHHSILYHLGVNQEMRRLITAELAHEHYDIVQTEFPHMAFFDVPEGPVRILDAHNIEYDNFRRMWEKSTSPFQRFQYHNEYRKFHREELEAFRRQDLLMFTSERDLRMAEADVPGIPKVVIPNGVDTRYFAPSPVRQDPFSMVYTGIMAYHPNADGVAWFLDEIFPRILAKEPRASVTIVGSDPPRSLVKRAAANVRITGFVEDVRPYTHRAEVTIVPLRMGGGTRLKILEALAMHSPVVSTAIGAEGLDLANEEHAMLADDPQAFADAVIRLFNDRALRDRLSRNGYDLVNERYEWSVIGETLDQAYGQALAAAAGGRSIND